MTKDQILSHALGINLFLTRGGELAKVTNFNDDSSDIQLTITILTGKNKGYCYCVTAEGKYKKAGGETDIDLAKPLKPEDIKQLLLNEPKEQKLSIDLKKCMEERMYLKTRVGHKALILHHVPEDMYEFKGVIIYPNGEPDSATWSEDGKCSSENGNKYRDIVGLWEE